MNCKHACFLGALAISMLPFASCDNDSKWNIVDGAAPAFELEGDHVMTEAGQTIRLAGKIYDADGISTISLKCPELLLDKTIDIIEIYGEPLTEYELDYNFKIQASETGDNFDVAITVTDVAGQSVTRNVLVTMDGDYLAPVFEASPDKEITVLIKANTVFNLKFTATDNREIDYIEVDVEGVDGFPVRIDGEGRNRIEYAQKLPLPNVPAEYSLAITAYDKPAQDGEVRSTVINSAITVSELPDFSNMYLADVATAAELNSDVFGVPMACDHVAPFTYRARYYNESAGTQICFIPQKTDFSPICFGPDALDSTVLGDDPETVGRITLDKAGVYYLIDFNIQTGTYSLSTYTPAEAVSPIMNLHYGQDDLNTWWETNDMSAIWWQEWYFGPASGPGDVTRMEQDAKNPHIFYVNDWNLTSGDELNFILHNWHHDGWWNFTTWRVDDSADPSRFMYYGNYHPTTPHYESNDAYFDFKYINVDPDEYAFMYPGVAPFDLTKWGTEDYRKNFVPDNWVKPLVKVSGKYRLVFDAHTERARLVPQD